RGRRVWASRRGVDRAAPPAGGGDGRGAGGGGPGGRSAENHVLDKDRVDRPGAAGRRPDRTGSGMVGQAARSGGSRRGGTPATPGGAGRQGRRPLPGADGGEGRGATAPSTTGRGHAPVPRREWIPALTGYHGRGRQAAVELACGAAAVSG